MLCMYIVLTKSKGGKHYKEKEQLASDIDDSETRSSRGENFCDHDDDHGTKSIKVYIITRKGAIK